MGKAETLGMAAGLRNLASRAEIIEKGLSAETLLEALVNAEGLMGKAKSALLSPSPAKDMVSPTKDARADRLSLPISPEKHEKRENQDHEDLAKTLNNLSATLRYVSTPAEKMQSTSAEKTPSTLNNGPAKT